MQFSSELMINAYCTSFSCVTLMIRFLESNNIYTHIEKEENMYVY